MELIDFPSKIVEYFQGAFVDLHVAFFSRNANRGVSSSYLWSLLPSSFVCLISRRFYFSFPPFNGKKRLEFIRLLKSNL